ncbi:hypothetical protein AB835_12555 [Candidatus Endobugula sertula]|uniref:Peptidase M48 domain-containing protein n=1 Tax=Candidatus Endobugula sertula TaxID=62101 RepID=A0A1D2QMD5_9GAMM|nr:hypothetical protein AB835_12555 [Candidatus Endobugula sertula]
MSLIPSRFSIFIVTLHALFVASKTSHANDTIQLPTIGRENIANLKEEERIGAAWLKQTRRQPRTLSDPILTDYVEQLLNRLRIHSDVNHQSLSFVIVKNPTFNARAVLGGVISINTGLLNFATTEAQFASILAHELAHISQRHHTRIIEKQKNQQIINNALFASIVLASTREEDAGEALLSAADAYRIDQKLRFSRALEKEADRIGLGILAKAGFNPHAAVAMFEQMNNASRLSSKQPEFLRTHPLTDNRIADLIHFTRKYPEQTPVHNIDYQLVKARTLWLTITSPHEAIVRFKNELSGFSGSPEASRYGLALALISDQQFDEAKKHISALLKKYPNNVILKIAESDILSGKGDVNSAIEHILSLQQQHPDYYPLLHQLSRLYANQGNFSKAITVLVQLTELRQNDPLFWKELAEISGLDQQLSMLNKARAEYFILLALFHKAKHQLESLMKREPEGSKLHQYAEKRLSELKKLSKL